jgi:hypothetical protein
VSAIVFKVRMRITRDFNTKQAKQSKEVIKLSHLAVPRNSAIRWRRSPINLTGDVVVGKTPVRGGG